MELTNPKECECTACLSAAYWGRLAAEEREFKEWLAAYRARRERRMFKDIAEGKYDYISAPVEDGFGRSRA